MNTSSQANKYNKKQTISAQYAVARVLALGPPMLASRIGDLSRRLAIPKLFHDLFLVSYLPGCGVAFPEVPALSIAGWIWQAYGLNVKSNHLKLALAAITAYMLGVQNSDQLAICDGHELYGRAVMQLADSFSHLDDHERLAAIASCRFFALFEVRPGRSG